MARREAEAVRREVEVARREMAAMRRESDVAARAAAPCGAAGRVRAQPPVRLMPPAPVTRVKLTPWRSDSSARGSAVA